jgi:hypothetical protein
MYLATCVKPPQVVKLNHFIYDSFVDIVLLASLSALQTQTRKLRHTNSDTTRASQPIVRIYQCNHMPHRMNLMLLSVEFKSLMPSAVQVVVPAPPTLQNRSRQSSGKGSISFIYI